MAEADNQPVKVPVTPEPKDASPSASSSTQTAPEPSDYSKEKGWKVWYRHSGEPEIDRIPFEYEFGTATEEEILGKIGAHHITHMCIENGVMPHLHVVAPKLRQLRLVKLSDTKQLNGLALLQQLQKLNLNDTKFPGGLPDIIGQLTSLVELSLENCDLKSLPSSLHSLTNLKWLYLSNNDFSEEFPDAISKLGFLDELYMYGCGLNDLPESLVSLTRLKRFWLNHNDFSAGLPAVLSHMTSLDELYLDNCCLTDLPKSMASLTELCRLSLNINDFSEGLPHVITELTSLEELYLTRCRLTTLPESLSALTQLKELRLGVNNFSKGLPSVIGGFTELEELDISLCRLTSLLDSMSCSIHLKSLYLIGNDFSKGLPGVIGKLTHLEQLHLNDCKLKELPASLCSLSRLKRLWLNGNDFFVVPAVLGRLTSLNELSLIRCHISRDGLFTLLPLTQLTTLYIGHNDFSSYYPEGLESLSSLTKLDLENCGLKDIPSGLHGNIHLKSLNLSWNNLESLPSALKCMKDLKTLNISNNRNLHSIPDQVIHLKKLTELDCSNCIFLTQPPYVVCQHGLLAMRRYWDDARASSTINRCDVPVAVVGNTYAGKSSIIQSLIAGERVLTHRQLDSAFDEITRVFRVESLKLPNSTLKFLDYGGNEVYHMAYPLLAKDQGLLLVVVNMKEFNFICQRRGPKEAARRVFFDWMSHIYLASPNLGRPILVVTHLDLLSKAERNSCRDDLSSAAELLKQEIIIEEGVYSASQSTSLHSISLFSDAETPLFSPAETFEFSNDMKEIANIKSLTDELSRRCEGFATRIPALWQHVSTYLQSRASEPFILLSDIKSVFKPHDITVILQYMHSTGRIFWFEKEPAPFSEYVFHQLSYVVNMIKVLFHHASRRHWKQRIQDFKPFYHGQRYVETEEYGSLIQEFTTSGVLDEALLTHLLETESKFPVEVAIPLLRCHFILFGPAKHLARNVFIVPYFSSTFMDDSWITDGDLQLRLTVMFSGLSPPKYVYQLLTVAVLDATFGESCSVKTRKNGATVSSENVEVHIVHDYNVRSITLQVSTEVKHLGLSWDLLLAAQGKIRDLLATVWKACHTEVLVYCAHCLYLRDPQPSCEVNPGWLAPRSLPSASAPVSCKRCAHPEPTVPRPLLNPCCDLTEKEVEQLCGYLSRIKHARRYSRRSTADDEAGTLAHETDSGESDTSDVENEGYCDYSADLMKEMLMKLQVVRQRRIKRLFFNTEKAYRMSDRIRGNALVINIRTFSNSRHIRAGSEMDYVNICKLLKDMRFEVVKTQRELTDLTAQQIYGVIKEETQKAEHNFHGMFVLVIMSHGRENMLYDCFGQPVDLVTIKNLISLYNFPAMKGKPKLMIVVAATPEHQEFLDHKQLKPSPSKGPMIAPLFESDNFFIMRSPIKTVDGSLSPTYGSWFIRVLVATYYKHSNHRDVESLFEIIKGRMRQLVGVEAGTRTLFSLAGQLPTRICTLTNDRKLFLFPGLPVIRDD